MIYVGVPHLPYIIRPSLGYKSISIYESYSVWMPKRVHRIYDYTLPFPSLVASGIQSPNQLLYAFPELQHLDLIFEPVIRFGPTRPVDTLYRGLLSLLGPPTAHVLNPRCEGPGDIYPPQAVYPVPFLVPRWTRILAATLLVIATSLAVEVFFLIGMTALLVTHVVVRVHAHQRSRIRTESPISFNCSGRSVFFSPKLQWQIIAWIGFGLPSCVHRRNHHVD